MLWYTLRNTQKDCIRMFAKVCTVVIVHSGMLCDIHCTIRKRQFGQWIQKVLISLTDPFCFYTRKKIEKLIQLIQCPHQIKRTNWTTTKKKPTFHWLAYTFNLFMVDPCRTRCKFPYCCVMISVHFIIIYNKAYKAYTYCFKL